MFVVFLDVDGVLCTLRSHLAFHGKGGCWFEWDPTSCRLLRRLLDNYDGKIVVSSTWRHDHHTADLNYQMKKHELTPYLHEDWRTKDFKSGIRGEEIKDWLDRHLEIGNYLILDDDTDFLKEQRPFWVGIEDGKEGFGAQHFMSACKILEEKYGLKDKTPPEETGTYTIDL